MPDLFDTFRDPFLSLYQSAISDVARTIDERAANNCQRSARSALQQSAFSTLPAMAVEIARREYAGVKGNVTTAPSYGIPRELSKPGVARVCAEMAFRYLRAVALGDEKALAELAGEYKTSTCDPAWITTLEEYRHYFGADGKRKAIPYIRAGEIGPRVIEIKNDAAIALVSDWGTGAVPANEILKSISAHKPDIFVHLGDIYYSGTPRECQSNFLDPITHILRNDRKMPVYTLAGNHDMYCGGLGFYNLISKLNCGSDKQPASFFCLRSADEKWQLLAMDTGLHDDNPSSASDILTRIEDDELTWHCERINEFDGRTILLSHHQLFSAFSPIGPPGPNGVRSAINPSLLKAFRQMTSKKKIAAWFWGHEHTLSIYKPFAGLERGRCIGNGAVPVSTIDDIYRPVKSLEQTPELITETRLGTQGGVYNHGYSLLTLTDRHCHAEYFQLARTAHQLAFQEQFT